MYVHYILYNVHVYTCSMYSVHVQPMYHACKCYMYVHVCTIMYMYIVYYNYVFAVQWRFLQRDEGERDPGNDPSWLEDDGLYQYVLYSACTCI